MNISFGCNEYFDIIYKQLGMHWYVFSTLATDALMLEHQAISSHSAE